MSDLDTTLENTNNLLGTLSLKLDEVNESVFEIDDAIKERLDRLDGLGTSTKSDTNNTMVQSASSLEIFHQDISEKLNNLPSGSDALIEEVSSKLMELTDTFDTVDESISGSIDNLEENLLNGMTELGDKAAELKEILEQTIVDNFNNMQDSLNESLDSMLGTAQIELLDELNILFNETLSELGELAVNSGDRTRDELNNLWGELSSNVTDRFEEILVNQVDAIGQQVISETTRQVMDDIVMTQLSAQLTAALSAQLPQLMTAKVVVGSVRSLLDALP